MPRCYLDGKIVGELDAPVALADWVRSELDQAERLDDSPYVQGRRHVLRTIACRYTLVSDD